MLKRKTKETKNEWNKEIDKWEKISYFPTQTEVCGHFFAIMFRRGKSGSKVTEWME